VAALENLLEELTSGDEARAEAAVSPLLEMGEDALPALRDMMRSPDVDTRWWGLRVLASSPHTPAEWLVPYLGDPAPEVRQCAALGLAGKPDEAAVEPLVRALSDPDSMVAGLSSNALVRIGGPAVPSLIDAVKRRPAPDEGNGSQSQRIHALRALAEIRDHRAIPVMMQVMQEESALLQHWAQEGLERLGLDMIYLKPQ
jgi:HEAT repeat protein